MLKSSIDSIIRFQKFTNHKKEVEKVKFIPE